jgi:L-iditol 2-dehydrogenase
MMWAYRLVEPGVFERVDVATPSPDALTPGTVLLRTLAGGICGSDIPKLNGQAGAVADQYGYLLPGVPGFPMHEVVGEVLASRHQVIRPGTRVVGWATRSDALAEVVITSGDQVYAFDDSLSATDAVLIQPLACVLEALDRVAVAGKAVGVIGLGPIGLLFAHAAKAAHATHIVGVDPVNRDAVAKLFGVEDLVTAPSRTWARGLADCHRPDIIIEAVGHQVTTLDDAIRAARIGGSILYFGIPDDEYYPLNMERMLRKNLALFAGVTRDRRRALARAHHYLMCHPELNDALISHRFNRDSIQTAYDLAATTAADRLKIVISLLDQ